jgi:hypothetical protein
MYSTGPSVPMIVMYPSNTNSTVSTCALASE